MQLRLPWIILLAVSNCVFGQDATMMNELPSANIVTKAGKSSMSILFSLMISQSTRMFPDFIADWRSSKNAGHSIIVQ
eukprot:SAG22_NODE_752_length_7449_cov_8.296463_1_plen_78_part_00